MHRKFWVPSLIFYQRGSRRPLTRQSRVSLPLSLAVRAVNSRFRTRVKAPRVPGCEAAEDPGREPVGIYYFLIEQSFALDLRALRLYTIQPREPPPFLLPWAT